MPVGFLWKIHNMENYKVQHKHDAHILFCELSTTATYIRGRGGNELFNAIEFFSYVVIWEVFFNVNILWFFFVSPFFIFSLFVYFFSPSFTSKHKFKKIPKILYLFFAQVLFYKICKFLFDFLTLRKNSDENRNFFFFLFKN